MPTADCAVLAARTATPRRIVVYGVTGSGKTTAAARIATATGLPWTDVDELTWLPGWQPVDEAEQRRRFQQICAAESWILDTAYGIWMDIPRARADLIIGLDYPRWLSLTRLLRRTAVRMLRRQPVCNGNTESVRQVLSSDSIIAWHFRSFQRKRQRLHAWAAQAEGPTVVLLRSPRELDRCVTQLAAVAQN